MVNDAIRNVSL